MISDNEFNDLYEKYYVRMLCLAHGLISDWEECSNVVTDVFITAWQKMDGLDTRIESWLCVAVLNKSKSYLRKISTKKRSRIVIVEYDERDFIEMAEDIPKLIESSFMASIIEDIQKLPPKAKEIFELSLVGKSTKEISSIMNVSFQNVLNQKQRAIQLLRSSAAKYQIQ